ncbi:hypothetical protein ACDF64_09940 [Agromyces sp. MMS24-JH15]|uniref:hypothetical protein n=1 Tax=Agromyces sp. MMS24-JH15 TaxID=3243765 RepID=UPI003749C5AD
MRLLDVRIVRWYSKLAYVLGALAAGWVLRSSLNALGTPPVATVAIGQLFDLVAILYGARVFRGRREPVGPARPWWRMTAWAPAGWVIGLLAVFYVAVGVIAVFLPVEAVGAEASSGAASVASSVLSTVWFAVVAMLYLNSARRSTTAPSAEPTPNVKPTVR